MKLIKSIVRPNKVDEVKAALEKLQVSGMTVTEVRGHGKQKGHTAIYRGQEYQVSLLPKMEIEVVVPDTIADDVIKAIIEAARTGEIGDGRVFVTAGERELQDPDGRTGALAARWFGAGVGQQVLDDEHLLAWPDEAELPAGELLDRGGIVRQPADLFRERRVLRPLPGDRGDADRRAAAWPDASPPAPDRRPARRRR